MNLKTPVPYCHNCHHCERPTGGVMLCVIDQVPTATALMRQDGGRCGPDGALYVKRDEFEGD